MKNSILHNARSLAPYLLAAACFSIAAFIIITTLLNSASVDAQQRGSPPPLEELLALKAERDALLSADKAKQRFTGAKGNFEAVSSSEESNPGTLFCTNGSVQGRTQDFQQSELNVGSIREQNSCADGQVVASFSEIGRLSYFRGRPVISAKAPEDRIRSLTVGGKEALLVEPPVKPGPHFLYVIKRQPSGSDPGILGAVIGRTDLESAVELAEQLLAK